MLTPILNEDKPIVKTEVKQKDPSAHLIDPMQQKDIRGIPINRVGISGIEFPLIVKQKDGSAQTVHSKLDMFGSLISESRGTNMSRFSEILMEWVNKPLSADNFKKLLEALKNRLQAHDVYVSAEFKYFMHKLTPVSKKPSILSYKCKFIGVLRKRKYSFVLQVVVPVTSYCPCSKELCLTDKVAGVGKGAHAQRGEVTVQVKIEKGIGIWLEDLIKIIESCGSCEIYSLLKRVDEKFVTEKGYANAKFCEDIAREVVIKLQVIPDMNWFRVKAANWESIHDHNAVTYITRKKINGIWRKSHESFF